MSRISNLLPTLLCGGFVLAAAMSAHAQDWESAGVVRVTDTTPTNDSTTPGCPSGQCPNGAYAGNCPHGCPPNGHCQHGHCKCSRCLHQMIDWFNPHGMCTTSPDHGFSPPVKRPIFRTPVVYRKQFPDSWTGAPGVAQAGGQRAPSVYMPTDTTQLGFYYQHVPYWMPNPGAIPPAPRPADWHVPMCQANLPGHHPAGVILGTSPTILPTPQMGPQPTPAAIDMQGLPPAPEPTLASIPGTLERTSGPPQLQPIN